MFKKRLAKKDKEIFDLNSNEEAVKEDNQIQKKICKKSWKGINMNELMKME